MATKPVPRRPAPRLYLATPEVDDPALLLASLPGLLAGADVAAVLLRLVDADKSVSPILKRVDPLAADLKAYRARWREAAELLT